MACDEVHHVNRARQDARLPSDVHYRGPASVVGHGVGDDYPHDHPEGRVAQQYRPDEVAGRVYDEPSGAGHEEEVARRMTARGSGEAGAGG